MAMGGDLGFGPIGSGPVASLEQPVGTPGTPTAASVYKLAPYAILHAPPEQDSAGVTKLPPDAINDNPPGKNSVGISKLAVYAIIGPLEEPTPFRRQLWPDDEEDAPKGSAGLQWRRFAPPAAPAA